MDVGRTTETEKDLVTEDETRSRIKILFWNTAGLRNKDAEFWDYTKQFDIIGMTETWIEEGNWENFKDTLPNDWTWKYRQAKRSHKKGRAKGGIVTGIKRIFKEEREGYCSDNILERRIELKGEKWSVITVYNPEGGDQVWQELKENLDDREEDKLILGGDYNARIGKKGAIINSDDKDDEERERNSKDKVINKQGKKMLNECAEKGWHILNGNLIGDEEGELTYISEQGESVIDYGIANEWALEDVDSFLFFLFCPGISVALLS